MSRQRDSSETPISTESAGNSNVDPELQHEKQQQQQLHIVAVQHDDAADHCYSSLETHATRRSQESNNHSNIECNFRGFERRYHSLYLKSFEISLLLENLLAHKSDDFQVRKLFANFMLLFCWVLRKFSVLLESQARNEVLNCNCRKVEGKGKTRIKENAK